MTTQRDPDAPTPPETLVCPDHADARAGWRAALTPLTPPRDGVLIPPLYEIALPLIEAGRAHGPLPALRSDEFLDAHPDQQLAALLIVGLDAALFPRRATVAALLKHASVNMADAIADRPDYISRWDQIHAEVRHANDRIDDLKATLARYDAADRATQRRAS